MSAMTQSLPEASRQTHTHSSFATHSHAVDEAHKTGSPHETSCSVLRPSDMTRPRPAPCGAPLVRVRPVSVVRDKWPAVSS